MVGWHHRLNGHESGWTPGVSDGQGGLACCGSWGCKESDMTERLNRTELNPGTGTIVNKQARFLISKNLPSNLQRWRIN